MSAEPGTRWWAKDAGWWRQEYVVILGEEFGVDGPAILDWLSCAADSRGVARASVGEIASGCWTAATRVILVINRALELGMLEDVGSDDFAWRLRLTDWMTLRRPSLSPALRRLIIDRDGHRCGICGDSVAPRDVHIDHIVPVALGGADLPSNLQVAHALCNVRKGARC